MVLRQCRMTVIFYLINLAMLLLTVTQGHTIKEDGFRHRGRQPTQLRTVESVVRVDKHHQETEDLQMHRSDLTKRSVTRESDPCSQERLDSLLRSCENAATASSVTATEDTTQAPLRFCGADCSHLVFLYANDCSSQEFLVNISGACKSSGGNFTVECIYAVVLVKSGISTCTKMVLDVDPIHEDLPMDDSRAYVDRQCCFVQTTYESEVVHEIYVDRTGRPVTNPPLEPPWLGTNSSDYRAVIEVLDTKLCLIPEPVTTTVATASPTTTDYNSTADTTDWAGTLAEISSSACSLQTCCRFSLFVLVCSVSFFMSLH